MNYIICQFKPNSFRENCVYLVHDNWDDFGYKVSYVVYLKGSLIGYIRIGFVSSLIGSQLPSSFSKLPEGYFSLGGAVEYYDNLKKEDEREQILRDLNDIAFNLDLLDKYSSEDVTRQALLRDFSIYTVKNQLNRVAHGGVELTDFNFVFKFSNGQSKYIPNEIDFQVSALNNLPPTNIHLFIGNNGVGKSTVLNGIINSLVNDDSSIGSFTTESKNSFSKLLYISLNFLDSSSYTSSNSEFDSLFNYKIIKPNFKEYERNGRLNNKKFFEDYFLASYKNIISSIHGASKKNLWNNAIGFLESDYTFRNLNVKSWETFITNSNCPELLYEEYKKLSSGHQSILLTLVNLANYLEEKTLVLIDEPEAHLHPPLISSFTRCLSYMLSMRNAVSILATHSPVIAQEVPKKCIWTFRAIDSVRYFSRPRIETFGENIGTIISEIFDYDFRNTGYISLIRKESKNKKYDDVVKSFNNELGIEAKAMILANIDE